MYSSTAALAQQHSSTATQQNVYSRTAVLVPLVHMHVHAGHSSKPQQHIASSRAAGSIAAEHAQHSSTAACAYAQQCSTAVNRHSTAAYQHIARKQRMTAATAAHVQQQSREPEQ